jgi:hypothetical protein
MPGSGLGRGGIALRAARPVGDSHCRDHRLAADRAGRAAGAVREAPPWPIFDRGAGAVHADTDRHRGLGQRLEPSNDRDWAPDVARQLSVERDGDRVTLHNVRDFEWQTPDTAIPRWETREYDLSRLDAVDMVVSYWMGPAIAHTLVSFGFDDGRHLTFSVEIRREKNEAFSISGGFFKQFELNLIVADENDILRLRSNVREEDVYLYRVGLSPQARRELFLAYLDEAERLRQAPEFYNTLTSNCTTIVFDMVDRIVDGLPRDIRLILSGYLPEYVYAIGGLDTRHSLEFLRDRGYIDPRARKIPYAAGSEAFSRAIRDGIPAADGEIIHASSP